MKTWLLTLPIKYKLLAAFGSILLMSVWLIGTGISTINKILHYNTLTEQIEELNFAALKQAAEIKEFSSTGFKDNAFLKDNESPDLQRYEFHYVQANNLLKQIAKHPYFDLPQNKLRYDSIVKNLAQQNEQITLLINTIRERGFQDFGVEGQLRKAIHEVENSSFDYNKVDMLMLRRHEKDFFLRKDLKYLDKFNAVMHNFIDQIEKSESDPMAAQEIKLLAQQYKSLFNYIVTLEERIGLSPTTGITGNIAKLQSSGLQTLANLTQLVKIEKDLIVQTSMIKLFSLLIFQLILGLILVVFYANLLTKAIKEIKDALVELSTGTFPENMRIRTKDEIAETKTALNNLVHRIKTAVQFAQNLGGGNLRMDYDSQYADDVLAKAIIKMKDQLVVAEDQQRAINWQNEGMAKVGELLKNEFENLEQLADHFLAVIIKYVELNQGALYLLVNNKAQLKRIATYAYGKKRFEDEIINVGAGLVGQCVLEQQPIHLTELPDGYVKITSGLGEATPANVLIIPMMSNDEIVGVLEFASFNPFSTESILYLQKASENIANILLSKQKAQHTEQLLTEAKVKSEMLAQQEEEMRQNTEELMATQEEMERQKKELLQKIEVLEKRLADQSHNAPNKKVAERKPLVNH